MAAAFPCLGAIPYDVRLEGIADEGLHGLLLQSSRLASLKAEPPASRAGLQRRVDDDVERLTAVLHSQGFYGAGIEPSITDGDSVAVLLRIDTGAVYLLADYAVRYVGASPHGRVAFEHRGPGPGNRNVGAGGAH